jgi:nicotinamidase-related amidase
MSKALFCIDMQVDHFPMGMLEVENSSELPAAINARRKEFQHVYFFKASYPADHIRFAGNHLWRKPGAEIEHKGQPVHLYPMYCIESSWGAELHPQLQKKDSDIQVIRGSDPSANPISLWEDPKFLLDLERAGIKEIELTGILIEQKIIKDSIDQLESNGYIVHLNKALTRSKLLPYF